MYQKFKKSSSVLMALAMLISVFSFCVSAADYTSVDGFWTYSYKSGTVTLKSYLGGSSYVVIPQKVDGYDVVALENTFANNVKVKEVVVSEGVETVSKAFTGSAVEKVTLPESLKRIEAYSFYQATKLEEVIMKEGVTFIGNGAFYLCTSLEYIDLPETVEYIGTDGFRQSGIRKITIPGKVETVIYNTFDCCYSLETVILGDGVKTVEECAFSECEKLTKVIIPASVTRIVWTGYEYGPFERVKNLTIYGYKNTAAETFADEFGYKFAEIVPAKSVTVTPASCTVEVGESKQLTATVMPENASEKTVVWSSSDSKIATVDANGTVKGIKNGTATITATAVDGGFSDTCTVTVHTHDYKTDKTKDPTCTEDGEKKFSCSCGSSYTEVIPKNGHSSDNTWVYESGSLFRTHCLVCGDSTGTKQVSISANYPSGIEMNLGQSGVKLSCSVTDNITDDLVFTSSDTSVATVSADGTVKALGKGNAVITVAIRNTSICITRTVKVIDAPCEIEIDSNPGSYTLNYGETVEMYAWTKNVPEGASIKWVTEGSGISVSVSDEGRVFRATSTSTGTATVKVMIVDENGDVMTDSKGNELSDSITIRSNASFWQKIVSFFKNLFGISRTFYIGAYRIEVSVPIPPELMM